MSNDMDKIKNKKKVLLIIFIVIIVIIAIITTVFIIIGNKDLIAKVETSNNSDNLENIESKESKDSKDNKDNIDSPESKTSEANTISTESAKNIVNGVTIKFSYDENYWEKYDLKYAVYKTQGDYEDAVCNYIKEITKLLNKTDWYDQYKGKNTVYIKLNIQDKDYYAKALGAGTLEEYEDTMPVNRGRSDRMADKTPNSLIYTLYLNSAMFEHNITPLVHALTDMITYNDVDQRSSFSGSLSTGLSEYVQEYLGMGIASCNHGLDIHNYVIEHKKICEKDAKTYKFLNSYMRLGAAKGDYLISSSLSFNYYWDECCNSFVHYLIQTYGIDGVMKMMNGYDESIYYMFNEKGLDGIISDWNQFLEKYPSKMTWDEMNAYIADFKSNHGY